MKLFIVFSIAFSVTLVCISEKFFRLNINKKVKIFFFSIIILDILYVTLINRHINSSNLIVLLPLQSYINLFFSDWKNAAVFAWRQIIGNVLIFIPFGMLVLELFNKKSLKVCAISGLVFSLLIETIQMIFSLGKAETDDIINNTLGAIFGFLIYYSIENFRNRNFKKTVLYLLPIIVYAIFMAGCMIFCSNVNVFYY